MQRCFLRFLIALYFVVSQPQNSAARIVPQHYSVSLSTQDSLAIKAGMATASDSLLRTRQFGRAPVYGIQRARPVHNATPDFYLLTALCLILGAIRYADPRYFALLLSAYRNPGNGSQWRDLLKAAALPNLGMNIFFGAVAGAYIYYISAGTTAKLLGYRAPLVLLLLIAGMLVMYAGKYAVIRFSGWAFRVDTLADQYLFNVFLINKIIGIVLLPFVVIIAFAGREWLQPMAVLSGVIVLTLLSTRYLRSWSAFYGFFKGSRFHFFTYLCASEILPMAVLVKWLLHVLR